MGKIGFGSRVGGGGVGGVGVGGVAAVLRALRPGNLALRIRIQYGR